MSALTPYDTGARMEPRLYVERPHRLDPNQDDEDFGLVDFDDCEGSTLATVWGGNEESDPELTIVLNGRMLITIINENGTTVATVRINHDGHVSNVALHTEEA